MNLRFNGRRQFLLLAALFAAPLLGAWLMYFVFPEHLPSGRTNHGALVSPARPLAEQAFTDATGAARDLSALRGKWSLVYVGGAGCDTACAAKLHQVRQVRLLLNEKRLRVQRVYLAPDAAAAAAARTQLAAGNPDLVVLAPSDPGALRAFFQPADPQAVYVVDPLGNYLMWYPADAQSKGMLQDIKKLLRNSQIG